MEKVLFKNYLIKKVNNKTLIIIDKLKKVDQYSNKKKSQRRYILLFTM